ncbi:MAG: hypothetical protein WKH64_08880 [Chloroflexia bacterium]
MRSHLRGKRAGYGDLDVSEKQPVPRFHGSHADSTLYSDPRHTGALDLYKLQGEIQVHINRRQSTLDLRRKLAAAATVVAALAIGLTGAAQAAGDTLDRSFDTDGRQRVDFSTSDQAVKVLEYTNGKSSKLVVVGNVLEQTGGNVDSKYGLTRLNPDGSLDKSFDNDGKKVSNPTNALDSAVTGGLQRDGRIVVLGQRALQSGAVQGFALVRYRLNGEIDRSFGTNGKTLGSFGDDSLTADMAVTPDDRILVLGATERGFVLFRYFANGRRDFSFGDQGRVTTPINDVALATTLTVQPNGKFVAAGVTNIGEDLAVAVVRYNADGSLDRSFDDDGKALTPSCQ